MAAAHVSHAVAPAAASEDAGCFGRCRLLRPMQNMCRQQPNQQQHQRMQAASAGAGCFGRSFGRWTVTTHHPPTHPTPANQQRQSSMLQLSVNLPTSSKHHHHNRQQQLQPYVKSRRPGATAEAPAEAAATTLASSEHQWQ